MNRKLLHILNALVSNLEVLNCELVRLIRSEQFAPDPVCYELIKRVRMACMSNLDHVNALEKALIRQENRKNSDPANSNDSPASD